MPARVSETFVLRTYPFREADLIVSFFTRDLGKLRGVARRARRPKSSFGSGLERLSQVRMAYFQKESAELVSLSGCELIVSQFALGDDYAVGVALDYFTEVAEQLLPPHEPNEKFFRLLAAVLRFLHDSKQAASATAAEAIVVTAATPLASPAASQTGSSPSTDPSRANQGWNEGDVWTAVTYFTLWAVRLTGIWPESRVSKESVEIAHEMFETPISELAPRDWTKSTAQDLRKVLVRAMEQHVERRFLTVPLLEAL